MEFHRCFYQHRHDDDILSSLWFYCMCMWVLWNHKKWTENSSSSKNNYGEKFVCYTKCETNEQTICLEILSSYHLTFVRIWRERYATVKTHTNHANADNFQGWTILTVNKCIWIEKLLSFSLSLWTISNKIVIVFSTHSYGTCAKLAVALLRLLLIEKIEFQIPTTLCASVIWCDSLCCWIWCHCFCYVSMAVQSGLSHFIFIFITGIFSILFSLSIFASPDRWNRIRKKIWMRMNVAEIQCWKFHFAITIIISLCMYIFSMILSKTAGGKMKLTASWMRKGPFSNPNTFYTLHWLALAEQS